MGLGDFLITSAERIINRTPPHDAADMSEANANNYMVIWDGIIDGRYRMRCGKYYATQAELFAVTGKSGEVAYTEEGDQYWRWNIAFVQWTQAF